jgi:hypothetical protein
MKIQVAKWGWYLRISCRVSTPDRMRSSSWVFSKNRMLSPYFAKKLVREEVALQSLLEWDRLPWAFLRQVPSPGSLYTVLQRWTWRSNQRF